MSNNSNNEDKGIWGSVHISYHSSGQVNYDVRSSNSGTSHEHDIYGRDVHHIDINGERLTRDSDGVLRNSDGEVYRGSYDD